MWTDLTSLEAPEMMPHRATGRPETHIEAEEGVTKEKGTDPKTKKDRELDSEKTNYRAHQGLTHRPEHSKHVTALVSI